MLPLFLDLAQRKVVVFGGGQVGLRKAVYFLKECKVTVVSRTFCEGFGGKGIEMVTEDALARLSEWVEGSDIVIAAVDDPSTNERIVNEAISKGKLYNNADGRSNFLIPSVVERDNYTVAISTMGKSPAMSKYIRIMLDKALGPELDAMVSLQEELRAEARSRIGDQRDRETFLWEVLGDSSIWDAVREGDGAKARKMAMDRMVKFIGRDP